MSGCGISVVFQVIGNEKKCSQVRKPAFMDERSLPSHESGIHPMLPLRPKRELHSGGLSVAMCTVGRVCVVQLPRQRSRPAGLAH